MPTPWLSRPTCVAFIEPTGFLALLALDAKPLARGRILFGSLASTAVSETVSHPPHPPPPTLWRLWRIALLFQRPHLSRFSRLSRLPLLFRLCFVAVLLCGLPLIDVPDLRHSL